MFRRFKIIKKKLFEFVYICFQSLTSFIFADSVTLFRCKRLFIAKLCFYHTQRKTQKLYIWCRNV